MEPTASPNDEMPTLYRAVLDLVHDLERLGDDREAARVRAEAIRVYSSAWDARRSATLKGLAAKVGRSVETRRSRPAG
jgi:hypothetical protein